MTSSRDKSKDNRRPSPAQVYEALHKKRAAEYEARTQWAGVTQYFKTWENNSNKFTNWTSPQYYKKRRVSWFLFYLRINLRVCVFLYCR